VQRFRQAELSWLRSGQTTTLFSSETEKEPVSAARGGMASIEEGAAGGTSGWAEGPGGRTGGVEGVNGTRTAVQRGVERWRRGLEGWWRRGSSLGVQAEQ
jgi:hypothetical protein